MTKLTYTMTSESVTLIHRGESHTIRSTSPNFKPLCGALAAERWEDVPKYLTVAKSIETWAQGDFKVLGEKVTYKGDPLPPALTSRILEMAAKGESPTSLTRFWVRLQANPSWRSVQQLWGFLNHENIPIDEDGFFLAYKAVSSTYKDFHTTSVDNTPGTTLEMPRNKISDDPREACHFGYHVGALAYAKSFGAENRRIIICRVDPADVVCVPHDAEKMKMRVCKYTVIGNYGGKLPSTTVTQKDLGVTISKPEPEKPETPVVTSKVAPVKPLVKAPVKKTDVPHEEWTRLGAKDEVDLSDESLDTLRKYATYGLQIVGASKIPGGKRALIERIIEVRRKG